MEVRNCARCGKMFRPLAGKRICQDCAKADREEYELVRSFLRKNPKASVMEVSQETGVSTKKIHEYVRSGRLTASADADWGVKCEGCGTPITTGRFCAECAGELEDKIQGGSAGSFMGRRSSRTGGKLSRDKFRRR